jgi:MFS family permease
MTFEDYRHGISDNLEQFLHQLFQVLLVGMTLGLMRTVVPALAETEFGVPRGSFLLLMAFVVAFGFVKGALNFLAGRLSERFGRRNVLLAGWFVAIPVPIIVYMAPSWGWIVFATVLLGVNQGLTWSMTQTSKLDVTRADQRGLTIGLNEFSGYLGVAIGGVMTGYLSEWMAPRSGLLVFGLTTITLAIINAWFWVKETLPWAKAEALRHAEGRHEGPLPRFPQNFPDKPSTKEMFWLMSWGDKRMAAFCQAGLVEKFVDALIWVFYPVYFYQRGLGLAEIGWVVGVYGFVWGGSQFLTGKLSDHVGRMWPIISGMWICGAGIGITLLGDSVLWWSFSAAVTGFGMALLYPNISAAVSDIAHPNWRGSAIGIYRFWRDLGYGIGALLLGLVANTTGIIDTGFWFVTIAMFVSGLLVWIMAEETHPRLNPAL